MTAEVADGWLPMLFMPEKAARGMGRVARRRRGQARPLPRAAADLDRGTGGHRRGRGRDRPAGPGPAGESPCTSGAWGPRGRTSTTTWSVVTASTRRPSEIQDLYLDGKKNEAAALVPDELLEARLDLRARELRGRADRRLQGGRRHPSAGHAPSPIGDQRPVDVMDQGQGPGRLTVRDRPPSQPTTASRPVTAGTQTAAVAVPCAASAAQPYRVTARTEQGGDPALSRSPLRDQVALIQLLQFEVDGLEGQE